MNNLVILIGVILSINDSYLEIKVDNLGIIKVFIDETIDNKNLFIDKLTKIEGRLKYYNFPFPVVVAEKIYQIKNDIS